MSTPKNTVFDEYLKAVLISLILPRKRGNNLWRISLMVFWVWHNKHSSFQKYPWWTWPHTQWSKEPKFSWVAFEDPEIVTNNAVRQTWPLRTHCRTLDTQYWTRSLLRKTLEFSKISVLQKWCGCLETFSRKLLMKTFWKVSVDWTKRES